MYIDITFTKMSSSISSADTLPDLWKQLCSNTRPAPAQNENDSVVNTCSTTSSKVPAAAHPLPFEHLALWSRNISLQQASLQDTMRKCLKLLQDQQDSTRNLQQLLESVGKLQARLEISGSKESLDGMPSEGAEEMDEW